MNPDSFDAIVIGSGQGGTPLSKAMANHGWRTALVERRWVGGTCVNTGCTPTKTMVASARVAYLARRAADFGVTTGPVTVDLAKVVQRKRDLVTTSRANNVKGLEQAKDLTILYGTAAFTDDPHTLTVRLNDGSTRQLTAPRIFLDVGVRTATLPIPGLDTVPTLDNESIMELEQVPRHLAILGGGYIALEFAQMFRRFGAEVTVLQHGERVAEQEDPDISDAIAQVLREDGIHIEINTEVTAAEQLPDGMHLSLKRKSGSSGTDSLTCSHLLIAAGRTPNTDTLNADRVGLKLNPHGFVQCNDRLETSLPGVWAIGDCKGGPEFTHISYDDFRILRDNLLEGGHHSITDRPVPYTMFTDPELGHIGMTETAARKAGRSIRVACMPASSVARARESDETRGVLKAIVDRDTDLILGASIFTVNGGELATQIQLAMMGNVTATQLRDGIFSHPTWSEALNTLFSSYQDEKS